ncbi:MAG: uS9 family ribosomal protein [Candidatus Beckwithbacteria bacterium]
MPTIKKPLFIYSRGRRRTAVARVRLFKKAGENQVNGLPFSQYFPGAIALKTFLEPFKLCGVEDKYHATVKVVGSGKLSQLTAAVHGLSRTLILAKPEVKPLFKKHGLLTRDPRTRQRRMIGTGGKSRRKKQSPKR